MEGEVEEPRKVFLTKSKVPYFRSRKGPKEAGHSAGGTTHTAAEDNSCGSSLTTGDEAEDLHLPVISEEVEEGGEEPRNRTSRVTSTSLEVRVSCRADIATQAPVSRVCVCVCVYKDVCVCVCVWCVCVYKDVVCVCVCVCVCMYV